MEKDVDGIWRATIEMEPGEYPYRFLVDGQWQDDVECPVHLPNPFGTRDAVRQVV
jgi:1,4-alpha-glucan branching enzyme